MLAEELREAALVHIWGRQVTPAVYNHRLPRDGSLVLFQLYLFQLPYSPDT